MNAEKKYYVGTAGWNIPRVAATDFPQAGSHLERYAQVFNCVEINSSFYRIHRALTFARWADSVPADFRFSVKLFKEITHAKKLVVSTEDLRLALEGPLALREKLGVLLVQLAPGHQFRMNLAAPFFAELRRFYEGKIAFEPRHPTWISAEAVEVLKKFKISIVFADPKRVQILEDDFFELGGFRYSRLHGSPEIYKSQYSADALKIYADEFRNLRDDVSAWCIFDNTTFGHATADARDLRKILTTSSFGASV